jgi:hypothetical protein
MAGGYWYNFDDILSNEIEKQKFCSWFWSGTNGNTLIQALNSNNSESSGSKIRRLNGWWPYIYCVVLNHDDIPGLGPGPGPFGLVQWRYCKVGLTEVDTRSGTRNRMEVVKNEIQKQTGKEAGIFFVLPVRDFDSRPNSVIEKGVREHIGLPVNKELVRTIRLPFLTEWVITTQPYINHIGAIKENAKRAGGLDTDFIRGIPKFLPPGNLPPGLMMHNGEVLPQTLQLLYGH